MKKVKKEKESKSVLKIGVDSADGNESGKSKSIISKLSDVQNTVRKQEEPAASSSKEKNKESSKKIPKHQAFANMSFEDENHHHHSNTGATSQSSNVIQITRC